MDLYDSRYNILKVARSSKGYNHTDEAKAKISAAHSGKVVSKETQAILSAKLKGRIVSEETRDKIRNALKGRTRPAEVGAKVSAARSVPIYLYEISDNGLTLIEKFSSITNAGIFFKSNKPTARRAC